MTASYMYFFEQAASPVNGGRTAFIEDLGNGPLISRLLLGPRYVHASLNKQR